MHGLDHTLFSYCMGEKETLVSTVCVTLFVWCRDLVLEATDPPTVDETEAAHALRARDSATKC